MTSDSPPGGRLPVHHFRRVALGLAVAAGLGPSTAAAQQRQPGTQPVTRPSSSAGTQSRLWYELTLGGSGARLSCGICATKRDVGAAVTGTVGAYASPKLRVGLELSRWSYRDEGVREHMSGLGVVTHYSPNPSGRLYLLGAAGWTKYRAAEFRYDAPRISLGAGYDIPAFGKFVVGNVIALDLAAFGELRNGDDTIVGQVGMSSVRAAVQVRRR
jgi:hypothetical protein